MDLLKLSEEIFLGRVRKIQHKNLPLSIYNYTELTQYSKEFNQINSLCRGLVLSDIDGEIIARPFAKFFNIEELRENSQEFSPEKIEEIWTKEDGSLIIAFWYDGWNFITRGSWESKQALSAPKLFNSCLADKSKTYAMELVGPSNINVTRGYLEDKLILLGVISTKTGEEYNADQLKIEANKLGLSVPKLWKREEFAYDLIKNNIDPNFEGVVIKNSNGQRCKVKTKTYIELHKITSNITDNAIFLLWKNRQGEELSLEGIPDEFFSDINKKISKIEHDWCEYRELIYSYWEDTKKMFASGLTRKDIAISYPDYRSLLSCALANLPPDEIAFKQFCKKNGA